MIILILLNLLIKDDYLFYTIATIAIVGLFGTFSYVIFRGILALIYGSMVVKGPLAIKGLIARIIGLILTFVSIYILFIIIKLVIFWI